MRLTRSLRLLSHFTGPERYHLIHRIASSSPPLPPIVLPFTLGHTSSALNPVFSPDGNRLAVNQGDGSLYLWDVDRASPTAGQLLFRFTGLDEYATFNGFSPDRRIAFAGSYFGENIRLYVLPVDDLVSLASSRLTRWWTPEECRAYLHAETCPAAP